MKSAATITFSDHFQLPVKALVAKSFFFRRRIYSESREFISPQKPFRAPKPPQILHLFRPKFSVADPNFAPNSPQQFVVLRLKFRPQPLFSAVCDSSFSAPTRPKISSLKLSTGRCKASIDFSPKPKIQSTNTSSYLLSSSWSQPSSSLLPPVALYSTAAAMASKLNPPVTVETLNPKVLKCEYAVRGKIVTQAQGMDFTTDKLRSNALAMLKAARSDRK